MAVPTDPLEKSTRVFCQVPNFAVCKGKKMQEADRKMPEKIALHPLFTYVVATLLNFHYVTLFM